MELLDQTKTNGGSEMMAEVGLPRDVYTDQEVFIRTVREGVSGRILKKAVSAMPDDRKVFVRLLETDSGNLHRFYKRKSLGRAQSEELLDTLKLYIEAEKVFGDREIAEDWLHTPVPALSGSRPVDLFDTFAGRAMVRQALRKISFGEFS
ncbi:antitoxin Xre/MbcA/ParS toxin-binding domain-containing protein [Halomonas sp.]|jgi:putative toxin-antitoxin system antitoxin component (TIGR02293 family)|uniref:antitoxin Xre/MbcA/ParS toxin-binding domain-containing protein n=1 Tax=Halomonas sp. TaxID=1486246 RepID=UPI0035627CDB